MSDAPADAALSRLLAASVRTGPQEAPDLVHEVCRILGARRGRLFVADYSLRTLQELDGRGPVGAPLEIAGTVAGRAFSDARIEVTRGDHTVMSIPLLEGTDRIGLLELDFDRIEHRPEVIEPLVRLLTVLLVTKGRYSDAWARARRAVPLSPAAEIQWDLLPPLSCATSEVAVGGILEPAYEIGGDSFDYALNDRLLEFAIIDASGHGTQAVLLATAAVNSLRHSRRSGLGLSAAYQEADQTIAWGFGASNFATGQLGSLDLSTGVLTWLNAGHVLPMLVRNGTYVGQLRCDPSLPMGLGGEVVAVAVEPLQPGDRVLFYTDGITESRSPDGSLFGEDRLADFLVRATLERQPVAETARRLSANVVQYVGTGLRDDATLLLIEYLGHRPG